MDILLRRPHHTTFITPQASKPNQAAGPLARARALNYKKNPLSAFLQPGPFQMILKKLMNTADFASVCCIQYL